MLGQLFTQEFLKTGICETPLWRSVADAELDTFIADLKGIYAPFKADSNLNEPVTENEILVRVLVKLGWTDILTQQIASKTRREDVPDMLLLPNTAAKTAALREKREDRRYARRTTQIMLASGVTAYSAFRSARCVRSA